MLTALHCLVTAEGFEAAVVKAVNGGGDADTIGAVTGALDGAAVDRAEMIRLTGSVFGWTDQTESI